MLDDPIKPPKRNYFYLGVVAFVLLFIILPIGYFAIGILMSITCALGHR